MSTDTSAPALETQALRVSYGRTAGDRRPDAGRAPRVRVCPARAQRRGQVVPDPRAARRAAAAAGSVRLLGEDPWRRRASLMERVGIVPERPNAPPEMTPRALSTFCARLYRRWDAQARRGPLRPLRGPPQSPFGTLSKGQKGAVMLALALGHSPELLLLDDPTLGLDVVARDAVYGEVIGDLADRGTTVFLTTHDLRAAEGVADRVADPARRQASRSKGSLEALKTEWSRPLEEIFTAVVSGSPSAPAPQSEVRS